MILIISEEKDVNTNHVMSWLVFWKVPVFRINTEDNITLKKININNKRENEIVIVKNEKDELLLNLIKGSWYRRGTIEFKISNLSGIEDTDLKNKLSTHLFKENQIIEEYINYFISKIPHIGVFENRNVNKLISLHKAKETGFLIPATYILESRDSYEKIKHKSIVTKCISQAFHYYTEKLGFMTYTESTDIDDIPERFFATKFQEKIEKEADIRVFYLLGECYAMAIMSQDNPQTSTDFRKYDDKNPNRSVPFNLPVEIKYQIDQLMIKMNLQTGSIDFVLTPKKEFVFLEINPVGQFGMTSIPCNYYLERLVASKLRSFETAIVEKLTTA